MDFKKYRLLIIVAALAALFFIWKEYERKPFKIALNHKDSIESKQVSNQLSSPVENNRIENSQVKK